MVTPGSSEQASLAERENQILQELLFHVNDVFHTRINFFLLAESIFFAAIATLWKDGAFVKLVMTTLGIGVTLILWVGIYKLDKRSDHLTSRFRTVSAVYKDYLNCVPLRPRVGKLFVWALPALMLAGWLAIVGFIVVQLAH